MVFASHTFRIPRMSHPARFASQFSHRKYFRCEGGFLIFQIIAQFSAVNKSCPRRQHSCAHPSYGILSSISDIHYPSMAERNPQVHCYDYQGKIKEHASLQHGQRYMSPTNGKCKSLVVQSQSPSFREGTVPITDCAPRIRQKAAVLTQNLLFTKESFLVWLVNWPQFVFLMFWPFHRQTWKQIYREAYYKPYNGSYIGQLWAARSRLEYEQRTVALQRGGLFQVAPIVGAPVGTIEHILQAMYPRQLMVYEEHRNIWYATTNRHYLETAQYVAVSYRQSDFPDRERLVGDIHDTCLSLGLKAYWLDFECTGSEIREKNNDIYRIADVFRGATKTLVMIRSPQQDEPDTQDAWWSWGSRIWTFPEILLSKRLYHKVGDAEPVEINLRQLANVAFPDREADEILVNAYDMKESITRLELLMKLKEAIWRRTSSQNPGPGVTPQRPNANPGVVPYQAERVYALMGFFPHRILPDIIETEAQALARLSMANDTDRIAERMVSLLPPLQRILPQACWYCDEDIYGAKMWDIEPVVQAAGVTRTGALVLDGCRAAAIRWKGFPRVAFYTKPSFRRWLAANFVKYWWTFILVGLLTVWFLDEFAAVFFVLGSLGFLLGPFLIAYANSGRTLRTVPWMIGVKGHISADEAELAIYGTVPFGDIPPKIKYAPTASDLVVPDQGNLRKGHPRDISRADPNIYTLVDTVSNTIVHFRAVRPPTVCIFVSREGGVGRFLLCSENCVNNELHKEAVVRLPTYIHTYMSSCDWIAIGTAPGYEGCNGDKVTE